MELFKCNDAYYSNADQTRLENPTVKTVTTINVKDCSGELACINEGDEFFIRDDQWEYSKQIQVFVTAYQGIEEREVDISLGTDLRMSEEYYNVYIGNTPLSSLSVSEELKRDIDREVSNYIVRTNRSNGF